MERLDLFRIAPDEKLHHYVINVIASNDPMLIWIPREGHQ